MIIKQEFINSEQSPNSRDKQESALRSNESRSKLLNYINLKWLQSRHKQSAKMKYLIRPEELQEELRIKKIFDIIDSDSNYVLDPGEMMTVLQKCGFQMNRQDINELYRLFNKKECQGLNFVEFKKWMQSEQVNNKYKQIINRKKRQQQQQQSNTNQSEQTVKSQMLYMPNSFEALFKYLSFQLYRDSIKAEMQNDNEVTNKFSNFQRLISNCNADSASQEQKTDGNYNYKDSGIKNSQKIKHSETFKKFKKLVKLSDTNYNGRNAGSLSNLSINKEFAETPVISPLNQKLHHILFTESNQKNSQEDIDRDLCNEPNFQSNCLTLQKLRQSSDQQQQGQIMEKKSQKFKTRQWYKIKNKIQLQDLIKNAARLGKQEASYQYKSKLPKQSYSQANQDQDLKSNNHNYFFSKQNYSKNSNNSINHTNGNFNTSVNNSNNSFKLEKIGGKCIQTSQSSKHLGSTHSEFRKIDAQQQDGVRCLSQNNILNRVQTEFSYTKSKPAQLSSSKFKVSSNFTRPSNGKQSLQMNEENRIQKRINSIMNQQMKSICESCEQEEQKACTSVYNLLNSNTNTSVVKQLTDHKRFMKKQQNIITRYYIYNQSLGNHKSNNIIQKLLSDTKLEQQQSNSEMK